MGRRSFLPLQLTYPPYKNPCILSFIQDPFCKFMVDSPHLWVGITDYDWFKLHSSKESVDEVNFWRPSSRLGFNVLKWGEPFLFKLHAPRNFIVGGGFFTKFLRLPVSLAWEAFGEANGARRLDEVRARIGKYRAKPIGESEDPVIGHQLAQPQNRLAIPSVENLRYHADHIFRD